MDNSNLFETEEEKGNWKSVKIGALILGSALFVGLFVLPMYVNDENADCKVCDFFNQVFSDVSTDLIAITKGDSATHDIQKTLEEVQLTVTQGQIKSYSIETEGMWSGDYIDGNKVPSGIQFDGNKDFQFRCYDDQVLETSTYFGTFKNLEGKSINVIVFSGDKIIQEQKSSLNQAVTLEGKC